MIPQAAVSAVRVDTAFFLIVGICLALLAAVTVTMVAFLILYDRRRHPRAVNPDEEGSRVLEVAWTVIPILLVMYLFWLGWRNYAYLRTPPPGAMPVTVLARQWSWSFAYANGKTSDALTVPLGKPVRLALTSADVIHSFFVPAFRIKEDCVPGMRTHLWFAASKAGTYDIFCTEYCGLGHSHMRARLEVVPAARFEAWLSEAAPAEGKPRGYAVLEEKGCFGCHTVDGKPKVGPTLKGIFGSTGTVVTGGRERKVKADADYLRRSIVDPEADIVKGFPPVMPKVPLADAELRAVIDYLVSIGNLSPGGTPTWEEHRN